MSGRSSSTDTEDQRCLSERQSSTGSGPVYYKIMIQSGIKKIPDGPQYTCHAVQPQSRSLGLLSMGGFSDAKVPSQEGAVPGPCEGHVGTPRLVQNVEGVRQCARVKALLCHPHLLLLEGLRRGQRLLRRASKGAEGGRILPWGFR